MRLLRALPLFLLTFIAPARLVAQEQDSIQVRSLSFEGPRAIPDDLLRSAILSTQTRCITAALVPLCIFGIGLDKQYVDARMLAADVVRLRLFYYQRGYRDAAVTLDTTRTEEGMDVRFRITAGRPVVASRVEVEPAPEPGLTEKLPLRPGTPLSLIDYELTRDTLTQRLANRGYAHAYVLANYEIPRDSPYTAHVRFEVAAGPLARFGPIEVTGAQRVSSQVVRRMLTFREGDRYSQNALLSSQRSLFSLEIFRHAAIDTVSGPIDSIVPIRVQVNEGNLHRFRVGTGMNTAEFMNAEGRWTTRNFMGGARRLEVRGRVTNLMSSPLKYLPFFESCSTDLYCRLSGSIAADFEQPWFFGSRNTLGLGVFAERLTLPQVYVRTARGASVSLRRVLGGGAGASLAFRPELTRLESDGDIIFCVNFVACDEAAIDQLRESHWLAPIGLSYALDRANNLFAPTSGSILRIDTEIAGAGTGSDFAYGRVFAELVNYHEVTDGVVLATRVRPGWAKALDSEGKLLGLHPQKRFFAGGSNSVRGFAQYRLGPKLLTVNGTTLAQPVAAGGAGCTAQAINTGACDVDALVAERPDQLDVRPIGGSSLVEANAELRFPLIGGVHGAAFVDAGQVWSTPNAARLTDLAWSPGLGVRYLSPIGPIRVDVGYNTRGAERITVVTTEVCELLGSGDARQCVPIDPSRSYSPDQLGNTKALRSLGQVGWDPYRSFLDRLQIHFSIGQAF